MTATAKVSRFDPERASTSLNEGIFAFTGHRPQRLGGYGEDAIQRLSTFAEQWMTIYPPKKGVVGMAQGWDMAVAEALLRLGIPLIAAVPFKGQESVWPTGAKKRYHEILALASEVHIVSEGSYEPWKMHVRNRWMVDRCGLLVSLWDGVPEGGTVRCVEYANLTGRPVTNLWTEWQKFVNAR